MTNNPGVMNQVICGDCLEVFKRIPAETVNLAVTSPPYNLGIDYATYNDKKVYQEYLDWLKNVWRETMRTLVPGGRFALNVAPTSIKNFQPIHYHMAEIMKDLGMTLRAEILWYKQTMGRRTAWGSWKSPRNPHVVPSWEYLLLFHKNTPYMDGNPEDADITSAEFLKFSDAFWYIPPESKRNGHPAPFPEELIYRLIKYYTFRGNTVLDMFGGTGTVAVVARKNDRNYIHIDVSEAYCEVASKRLSKVEKDLAVTQAGMYLPIPNTANSNTMAEPDVEYEVEPQPYLIQD